LLTGDKGGEYNRMKKGALFVAGKKKEAIFWGGVKGDFSSCLR